MRRMDLASAPFALTSPRPAASQAALWALLVLYAIARILQIYPGPVPTLGVVALHVLCPALFAIIHGKRAYGWAGICVFLALCLLVGNLFENLGVLTGFPYGRYYFTRLMGPKILTVPIFLGLAYVGMAYLSWTLAEIVLRPSGNAAARRSILLLPLIASFFMVSWDLSQDAIWSTVLKAWIWLDGGPYFGVPLTNFAGWFLTVFVIYLVFALYQKRSAHAIPALPLGHWYLAVAFYALSAAGNLLLLIPTATAPATVSDPTGGLWRVHDIVAASALVSIFTMGTFAVIAAARLALAHTQSKA